MKILVPMNRKLINGLKEAKEKVENNSTIDDNNKIEESYLIGEKIHHLESQLLEKAQATTKIQNEKKGEKIGTYWTNINKNKKNKRHYPST